MKVRPRGTVIEDTPEPEPALPKNEDLLAGIARLERRARKLRADLARIASAPFPSPVSFGDISAPAILGAQLVTHLATNRGGSSPEHGAINIIEGRR